MGIGTALLIWRRLLVDGENHSRSKQFSANSKSPVGTVSKAILLPYVEVLSIATPPVGCSGARCDLLRVPWSVLAVVLHGSASRCTIYESSYCSRVGRCFRISLTCKKNSSMTSRVQRRCRSVTRAGCEMSALLIQTLQRKNNIQAIEVHNTGPGLRPPREVFSIRGASKHLTRQIPIRRACFD